MMMIRLRRFPHKFPKSPWNFILFALKYAQSTVEHQATYQENNYVHLLPLSRTEVPVPTKPDKRGFSEPV